MQVNNNTNTINPKMSDSKMYLWLLIGSLLLTNILVLIWMIPIYKSMDLHFGYIMDYLTAGYKEMQYPYANIISQVSVVAQNVCYVFFLCMVGIFAGNIFVVDFLDFKENRNKYFGYIALFAVVMYFSDTIVSLIYSILGETGTSANQLAIYAMLNGGTRYQTILLCCILAPVVEELIYRKFMIGFLNTTLRVPLVLSGIISACVFAFIHVSSSIYELRFFPMYFIMGGILVLSYLISKKNIYVSIGVHMINNIISIVLWAITFSH